MNKGITRRDWLKLIGGSAVGLMITPIPWKILDETAKWSQNWSWTPVPRDGKINFKYTTCTICPMACGVRVKCVDNQPVGLMGIQSDPMSGGGMCALGLGGHLLPYHPLRLLQTSKTSRIGDEFKSLPYSFDDAVSAITAAILSSKKGSVAILDAQPKRSISFVYRKFLAALSNGIYITTSVNAGPSAEIMKDVLNDEDGSFGFDIENTLTVLSFGTPVFDGWGTLGQFSNIVKRRNRNGGFKLIQVESLRSRTAQLADQWIPARPGTEAAFALAVSNVLINEQLCSVKELTAHSKDFHNQSGSSFVDLTMKYSPADASEQTGISADKIVGIARELASRKPSLVLAGGNPGSGPFSQQEQTIFMDLNVLLGAIGTRGGLVRRNELPAPLDSKFQEETPLDNIPDDFIKVLIMDASESGNVHPWRTIKQKLVTDEPLVVSLSPYFAGVAVHADYIIPAPTFLESFGDIPTPPTYPSASYSVSAPVLRKPENVNEPVDVIRKISTLAGIGLRTEIPSAEGLLKNRVEKIFMQRKGFVFDSSKCKTIEMKNLSSPSQLMTLLSNGGCWTEKMSASITSARVQSLHNVSFFGRDQDGYQSFSAAGNHKLKDAELVLLPYAACNAQPHQLMTKLYSESNLLELENTASINPETARKFGLADGSTAIVKTEVGTSRVSVKFDTAIMPGVLQVAIGPGVIGVDKIRPDNILEICPVESNTAAGIPGGDNKSENNSTWRTTKVQIQPA